MTIEIIGLGPGGVELLTSGARAVLDSGIPVILRTREHPAARELDGATRFLDCDDLYRSEPTFDGTYEAIARRVLAAAQAGDVAFAVPGGPLVSERAVAHVVTAADAAGIPVRIHPALSYVDVAAVALRHDLGDIQLCDAHDLRIDPRRAALVAQLHDRDQAAELKLALLDVYPAEHVVTVLGGLGTASESVVRLPLAELDHRPFDHLSTLYLPPLLPPDDVRTLEGLRRIVAQLHAPGGCPWDREQTHDSLRHHLLEESYELLEAIDSAEPTAVAEELGDVLLQVFMHAEVAQRQGEFNLGDVVEGISRKLIRRHPHVFAGVQISGAQEAQSNWDRLKEEEKPDRSTLSGVPSSLPALAASQALQARARRAGFDWPDIEGPLDKLAEEVGEFARAETDPDREAEFGDILFVVANIAQRLGIDAEQALRGSNARFRQRFGVVEALAAERGLGLRELDITALDALWDEAKVYLAGPGATTP